MEEPSKRTDKTKKIIPLTISGEFHLSIRTLKLNENICIYRILPKAYIMLTKDEGNISYFTNNTDHKIELTTEELLSRCTEERPLNILGTNIDPVEDSH